MMHGKPQIARFFIVFLLVISGSFLLHAQDGTQNSTSDVKGKSSEDQKQSTPDKNKNVVAPDAEQSNGQDPLNRPKPQTPSGKREKLSSAYKKWLDEDVRWIITSEEESAFKKLSNDSERETFIEGFWLRRDPTPDTQENEYKEEHYRRIAYANEHFAAGVPGWKTDRGRIYIMFGPPDTIDAHPMGGPYQRSAEEGGGSTETFPFEVWRYRYLEALGQQEVEIEFVDDCGCGAYQMTIDRSKKDALLHVPNAGLTTMEEMGMANKADRFRGGLEQLGSGTF